MMRKWLIWWMSNLSDERESERERDRERDGEREREEA